MDALARRVERRLIWRLIVPIAVITFVNSIDRVTVSFAGSAISRDLALSPDRFGLGVSMFFIAFSTSGRSSPTTFSRPCA